MAKEFIDFTDDDKALKTVSEFYDAFHKSFEIKKSPAGDFLFNKIQTGTTTIYNKSIRETKIFDNSFVDILRAAFPSLMKIVRDPRRALKYEQEVINMEKAKKVDSDSIRHLASHTQYIKEIRDNMVIPSKILTTYSEDDIAIYENRFVKTLINHCIRFIDNRLNMMKKNLESYQSDEVRYQNKIEANGSKYEVNIQVKLSNELEDAMTTARKILYDVQTLSDLYHSLKATPLCQALQKAKDVNPPIMKTNIILHNADFKVAYNTWIYLEKSNSVAYNVEIKERKHNDNKQIISDMNDVSTVLINDIVYHRGTKGFDFSDSRRFKKNTLEYEKQEDPNYEVTPSQKIIEHNEIPEYVLEQAEKLFSEKFEDAKSTGMSYEMSIKEVTKDMILMINKLYPTLFNEDILENKSSFTKAEKLDELKKQVRILKIVNKQKEIDLKKGKREQNRVENQIASYEKKLKEEAKKEKERIQREEKALKEKQRKEAMALARKKQKEVEKLKRMDKEVRQKKAQNGKKDNQ